MHLGPRRLSAVALVGALTLALAGCGEDAEGDSTGSTGNSEKVAATPTAQVTVAPSSEAEVIGVTITETSVSPDGARIKVERNQQVVLEIDAVAAGELHVHSTPEKELEYPAGKSQISLRFKKAGVVDIEDHGLDKLIVQLEVE